MGRGCHDLHLVLCEKLGEVGKAGDGENREIAPVYDMSTQISGPSYDLPEAGVEFRGPAGDIQSWDVGPLQHRENRLHHLIGHNLVPVRTRIPMTVLTALVALLPHVDLENRDPTVSKGASPDSATCQPQRGRRIFYSATGPASLTSLDVSSANCLKFSAYIPASFLAWAS